MHRGRFGGNARKRKSKLNDDTFNAMISGPAAIVDRELDVLGEVDTATIVPFVVSPSGLGPITPADLRLRGSLRDHLDIDLARYRFGYTPCPTCRSDQAYYVHEADLDQGFTFRCRICRHEMTVNLSSPSED